MNSVIKASVIVLCLGVAIGLYQLYNRGHSRQADTLPVVAPSIVVPPASPAARTHAPASPNMIAGAQWDCYHLRGARGNKTDLTPEQSGLPLAARAFRVTVVKAGDNNFDLAVINHFGTDIFQKGEALTLHFKARSSSAHLLVAQIQRDAAATHEPTLTKFIKLTPQWGDYDYTFMSDYPGHEEGLIFKMGDAKGVVDIADVSLAKAAAK